MPTTTSPRLRDIGEILDEGRWSGTQINMTCLAALAIVLDGFDGQLIGFAIPSIIKEWGLTRAALRAGRRGRPRRHGDRQHFRRLHRRPLRAARRASRQHPGFRRGDVLHRPCARSDDDRRLALRCGIGNWRNASVRDDDGCGIHAAKAPGHGGDGDHRQLSARRRSCGHLRRLCPSVVRLARPVPDGWARTCHIRARVDVRDVGIPTISRHGTRNVAASCLGCLAGSA